MYPKCVLNKLREEDTCLEILKDLTAALDQAGKSSVFSLAEKRLRVILSH